ncbi:hypothetical protein HPB48_016250 [Haemaphysalis longicornis]|uniref:Ionotropic receptor n=1 Tax=Haemaphysalis longicornis TaxID=44386 RepID=A0A9J6GAZ9_HAELO|nr:hypothetical protein HPB48_016250 [Haemaphysalis longicornis]
MEAYAALNTSVIKKVYSTLLEADFAILNRDADIDAEPKPFFRRREYNFYFHAMYPPCHICIFTRFVTGKGFLHAQESTNIVIVIVMFFVLALAIVFVSRCAPSGVHPTRLPAIVTFLASTFLGRSPQTLGTTGATLKALLTLWLFGTLIVGLYLQSHITADVYAPSFSREVEDINEFEKLLEANRVLSCLEFTFFTTALVHIKIPFIKKLGSIIKDRPYDFIPLGEQNGCDRRVRLGGHVHVRPCCSYDEYIAFQQGLAKGRGSFQNVSPGRYNAFKFATTAAASPPSLGYFRIRDGLSLQEERWSRTLQRR